MSIRPIVVLLKTNADFFLLLEIRMSGEWKDDNFDLVVEKITRQNDALSYAGGNGRECSTSCVVQECHILSPSLS